MPNEPTYALYTLTQDVKNPHSDKRHRYDWTKRELWRKGETFEIERLSGFEIVRHVTQAGHPYTTGGSMSMARHPEQFAALRPHLALKVEEPKEVKLSISEVEKLVEEVSSECFSEEDWSARNLGVKTLRDEILARLESYNSR